MKNVSVCVDVCGLQPALNEILMIFQLKRLSWVSDLMATWQVIFSKRQELHSQVIGQGPLTWWLWLQIIVDGGSGAYLT